MIEFERPKHVQEDYYKIDSYLVDNITHILWFVANHAYDLVPDRDAKIAQKLLEVLE